MYSALDTRKGDIDLHRFRLPLLNPMFALAGLILLGGCNLFYSLPDTVHLSIHNNGYPDYDDPHVCQGSLKVTLRLGSLVLQGNVPPNGADSVQTFYAKHPDDAPVGTLMTVEAWCFEADGTEKGYAKVARNWHTGAIPTVVVEVPYLPPGESFGSHCLPTQERRGLAPCIISDLLE